MKAILEFQLPEERVEHQLALDGGKWMSVMSNLDEKLRSWNKHGHEFKTADEALEAARLHLHELISDSNLTFDMG